jgi:DNA-binding MarR family transcriptional regulator/N-acetylglutamate synthase-like GNAT family acetyltransferase
MSSTAAHADLDHRALEQRVAAMRRFNRFYTRRIGVLPELHMHTPFSLAEGRVLYELAHREKPTAAEMGKELDLDAGYLSRILRRLEKRGLVSRRASETDGRQSHLSLTKSGRAAFATLNQRAHEDVASMLGAISEGDQRRVIEAMHTVEQILGDRGQPKVPYLLRQHQVGDMGWIVYRQAVLYAEEYGFDEHYEALAAKIAARFIERLDPKRERCWIAEREGEIVGCVMAVKKTSKVAQLRLLYVESSARGLGIGKRLVAECVRFARQVGYRKLVLWTQQTLVAARHLYEDAGFRVVHSEPHHSFSKDLVAETWELEL